VPVLHRVRPGRPRVLALAVGLLLASLAGCGPTATPSASPSASTLTTAAPDLTAPGAAQRAVEALQADAGGHPVVRVTVQRTGATLTYVADAQAVTLGWTDGVIAPVQSNVTFVDQQSFNPAAYSLGDVGALFRQAADVAGSDTAQELQINEYNQGRVLMTVTTTPESATVFFSPDGTIIPVLDLTTAAGLAQAIADTTTGTTGVVALGLDAGGWWADVRVGPTQVEHRVRPAKLPAYTVVRDERNTATPFAPGLADPAVIASLLAAAPGRLGRPATAITFTMDTRDALGYPVLHVSSGTATLAFTPGGTDITNLVGT